MARFTDNAIKRLGAYEPKRRDDLAVKASNFILRFASRGYRDALNGIIAVGMATIEDDMLPRRERRG